MKFKYKFGVIGFGNMSKAIVDGARDCGFILEDNVLVYDIDSKQTKHSRFDVAISCDDIAKNCEFILFAVKPQNAHDMMKKFNFNDNVIISIMAGITSDSINAHFDNKAKIVRCMPNTPCAVGEGMTAICYDQLITLQQKKFIDGLFGTTGLIMEVEENQLDAVTSISGSGPAYFYYFINSVINAGIENGLPKDMAKKLVVQTAIGACKMVSQTKTDPEELLNRVCSKGGTTIEAINHFNDSNLNKIIMDAIIKCYNKAKEM